MEKFTSFLSSSDSLSDPATGLKLNWTLARAGDTRNVIPASASAQADIRALLVEDFERVEKTLNARILQKKLADSAVHVKFEMRRPPLVANEQSQQLGDLAKKIYQDELGIDLTVTSTARGGGTDAAFAGLQSNAAIIEWHGIIW